MSGADYKVMDMPTHLGRRALKQDPFDPDKWIRDGEWYQMTKEINRSLYKFFQDNHLIERGLWDNPIEEVVLKLSDFNQLGKNLIRSGAVDKWLGSFDRPGSKKAFSDVRYLEKALLNIS